jgi:anti-anti-sigma factor
MSGRYEITDRGRGIHLVHLAGKLDYAEWQALEEKIQPLLPAVNLLLFDLEKLSYISSVGVKVLLRTKKDVARIGGTCLITNSQPSVGEVFKIAQFLPNKGSFKNVSDEDVHLDLIFAMLQGERPGPVGAPGGRIKHDLGANLEAAGKTAVDFKAGCPLCATLSEEGRKRPLVNFHPDKRIFLNFILHETDKFAVIFDPFPVEIGHALVIPKKHYLSFSSLPDDCSEKFGEVAAEAKKLIGAPSYFEFEHGTGISEGLPAGCGNSVYHAHWHLIPVHDEVNSSILYAAAAYVLKATKGLAPYPVEFEREANLSHKIRGISGGGPYLLMKYNHCGFIFQEQDELKVPSQILRKVAAKFLVGKNEFWDWKSMTPRDIRSVNERLLEFGYRFVKK